MTTPTPTSIDISDAPDDGAVVVQDMVQWLERAVIGLNLCPFAKSVHIKDQIHYVVSGARDLEAVLIALHRELEALAEISPEKRDTTLLVLPYCFSDFLAFNDFLDVADVMLEELDLGGILQIASFHPRFQFEGTQPDDVTNATNWAPYPTLHLLRESSIDRAVEAFPEAESIYERNIAVLEKMGAQGWANMHLAASVPASDEDMPLKGAQ